MKRLKKRQINKYSVQDLMESYEKQAASIMYFWFGFILFFVSLLFLAGCYRYYLVERNGVVVKMTVQEHYKSSGRVSVNDATVFFYNGEQFKTRTGVSFCVNHPVGDQVAMRYAAGIHVVLFPDENTDWMFQILGIIAFAGLGMIVYYFVQKKRI
jgi:hypothetical protein